MMVMNAEFRMYTSKAVAIAFTRDRANLRSPRK
jgi:hypothetical protein